MTSQDSKDEPADESRERFVVVESFPQPYEADTVQSMLDSVGIESFVEGENTIAVDPFLSNAIGGIRLLVREQDAEAAIEVLRGYYDFKAEMESQRKKCCPNCQSESIVSTTLAFPKVMAVVILVGISYLR